MRACFFFNDTATTEIYTLSLHDALPISLDAFIAAMRQIAREAEEQPEQVTSAPHHAPVTRLDEANAARRPNLRWRDRKSTRLNSSHANISYAVFCLKKKKKTTSCFSITA